MRFLLCAVAVGLLLRCGPGAAQVSLSFVDPGLNWRTLETPHFSIHFAEQHRRQANLVAGVAEGVYPRITRLLSWQPRSRTHVVVLDSADFSNGFASPLPFNTRASGFLLRTKASCCRTANGSSWC